MSRYLPNYLPKYRSIAGRLNLRIALIIAVCATAAVVAGVVGSAATPTSGTLSPSNPTLTYKAGPFVVPNESGQGGVVTPVCSAGTPTCDIYTLTVNAASVAATKNVVVQTVWPNTTADFDLYVYQGTTLLKASSGGSDPETVILDVPADGTVYTIRVIPTTPLGDSFTTTISLMDKPPAPGQDPGLAPRYQNYVSPSNLGNEAGEPSIGVDWNVNVPSLKHDKVNTGGVAFFTSGNSELRASFDDATSPARDLWEDVSSPYVVQSVLSDPIGYVDRQTGRVFQLNLIGGEGNSFMAYSDDDGNTTHPAQGGGVYQGYDHETLGGGPYAPGAPSHSYPNAVYYCSQSGVEAECSRSDDGGVTFGPGIPIFQNVAQCTGGIHGHVKVAPDGTVYVPNSSCGAGATVAVSKDNGLTWTNYSVPGSSGSLDPSVGIGLNDVGKPAGQTSNTIYIGWVNGDGHPFVAVSHDQGAHWTNIQDVGTRFGIKNTNFPVVAAGDDNRAAFGFLGTPTAGNPNDASTFKGIWHLYISTTYDGGNSWTTIDATPDDPVQVGSICTSGTTCGSDRNLLDFNDMTVDREGRVLLGYADGCLAPSCTASSPNTASRSDKATIARQSGGRRLFSAFDPTEPTAPAAPLLNSATRLSNGVDVRWSEPDNGGSALTGYKVYRGTTSGGESLLATIAATKPAYVDTTADPNTNYFYKVSAVNSVGEGPSYGEVSVKGPVATGNPCKLPGVTIVTDPSGDERILGVAAGLPPQLDLQSVSIAEPLQTDGKDRLVFTIKVDNLNPAPQPNGDWQVTFLTPDGTEHYVEMNTYIGIPSYEYGHFEVDPNTGINNIVSDGTADAGANSPDGTITITLSNSKLGASAPKAGDTLTSISGNTAFLLGAGVGFVEPVDGSGASGYTLAGNASCAVASPSPSPSASPSASPSGTPNPACNPPGVKVLDDPANDQTGAPNLNKSQDIQAISIAEQYPNGVGQLVITMKVGSIDPSTMPPNSFWQTNFTATHADNTTTTYFVNVATNSSSNAAGVAYRYGFRDTAGASPTNLSVGTADGGSISGADGTLTVILKMDKLKKPVPPAAGQTNSTLTGPQVDLSAGKVLSSINGTTSVLAGALGTGFSSTIDSTGNGSYTMAGAAACPAATPTPVPSPSPLGAAAPRYQVFNPPEGSGLGLNSGEPSIGVNWKTGKVFYQSDVQTLRVSFDDSCPSLSKATWENKSPLTSQIDNDPILYTDSQSGHTVVSMLFLLSGQSESSVTDTDGDVWVPSQGSGITSGIDHQTIGGGPFHQPLPAGATSPGAVYYCSQDGVNVSGGGYANCALSVDGGVTYGPAVPVYGIPGQCGGLHGHIKVSPEDGTAYLPNKSCGGKNGVIYSTDNGATWKVTANPYSTAGSSDPSVGVGGRGTVYFGYVNGDGHPHAAVLKTAGDGTKSWTNDQDVGSAFGIQNITFPAVVAGDDDRAAFAFLGSTTAGDMQASNFAGVWYLYVSTTYDGGKTWTTINATPNDPVQRGPIWLGGGANIARNLLDFMDATVDSRGRVLVGFADGCTGKCAEATATANGNSYTALASIARQSGGKGLFSVYDQSSYTTTAPGTPVASALKDDAGVHLSWTTPDNGGSAITGYKVFRRPASGGSSTLVASVGPDTRSYLDTPPACTTGGVDTGSCYSYYVTAVNAVGESGACGNSAGAVTPVLGSPGDACVAPGITVAKDAAGDQTGGTPNRDLDITAVSVAEPYYADGSSKLVFTMNIADLENLQPNRQYRIFWNSPAAASTGGIYYVGMNTDENGKVSFEYGTAVVQVVGLVLGVPVTTKVGDADPSSTYNRNGISIVVDKSKVGNPKTGDLLGGILGRTFTITGNTTTRSTTAIDSAFASSYTGTYKLIGNAACAR